MAAVFLVGAEATGPAAAAVVLHEGAGPQVTEGAELAEEFVAAEGEGGGIRWIGHGAALGC